MLHVVCVLLSRAFISSLFTSITDLSLLFVTPPRPHACVIQVDHYAVLGVNTDATDKQLKTAYRMRSLQVH